MNKKEKNKLKLIEKALKDFPKIVRQKELVHKEKEKILKAFLSISKELQKRESKN